MSETFWGVVMIIVDLNKNLLLDYGVLKSFTASQSSEFVNAFKNDYEHLKRFTMHSGIEDKDNIYLVTFSIVEMFTSSKEEANYTCISTWDHSNVEKLGEIFLSIFLYLEPGKTEKPVLKNIDKVLYPDELNAVLPALEEINGKFQPKLTKPHVVKYFNYPEIINYPKDVISHLWDVSTAYIEARRKNPPLGVYSIDDLIRETEDFREPDYNRDEPPF